MNASHWQADELANRVKARMARYKALSDALRVTEKFCSNDSRENLPVDFIQEVQNFRQSIDRLLGRLASMKDSLTGIKGAEFETLPAWLEMLNEFDQLNIEGGRLVYAGLAITERQKQLSLSGT